MEARTVIRWLSSLSVVWWVLTISATWLITARLPHWTGGPFPNGCYLRDAMIFYVECSGTWNDGIFGWLLSLALFWTAESLIMVPLWTMSIVGIPIAALWLASAFFAAHCLLRLLLKPIRALLRALYDEILYRLSE